MSDPYKILGISKSASPAEIRSAYRALAKKLHPDANPNDKTAEERFKKVGRAFHLLSDAKQRARYDRGEIDANGDEIAPHHHFRSARQGRQGGEFTDIFSDLFNDFGASAPRAQRGGDLSASLEIEFATAAQGGSQLIHLPDGRKVSVKIPAGVEDGKVLRLGGQGQKGQQGGPNGDLLITLKVKSHRWFSRDGDNIRLDLPVSVKEAALGAKVRVPTLHGDVDVKIPPNSSSGSLLRLKGRGIERKGKAPGDQIVRLMIDVPDDAALRDFLSDWTPPAGYNPRKNVKI